MACQAEEETAWIKTTQTTHITGTGIALDSKCFVRKTLHLFVGGYPTASEGAGKGQKLWHYLWYKNPGTWINSITISLNLPVPVSQCWIWITEKQPSTPKF